MPQLSAILVTPIENSLCFGGTWVRKWNLISLSMIMPCNSIPKTPTFINTNSKWWTWRSFRLFSFRENLSKIRDNALKRLQPPRGIYKHCFSVKFAHSLRPYMKFYREKLLLVFIQRFLNLFGRSASYKFLGTLLRVSTPFFTLVARRAINDMIRLEVIWLRLAHFHTSAFKLKWSISISEFVKQRMHTTIECERTTIECERTTISLCFVLSMMKWVYLLWNPIKRIDVTSTSEKPFV